MSRRHEAAPGAPTASAGLGGGPAATDPDDGDHQAPPSRIRLATAHVAGGDLRAGLAFLLGLTVAGPLLGLLWAAIAPRLDVAAGISGSETAFTAQADIDATFGFICLAAGIVAGVLARWRAADAGWPVPVGLAGGGLAGSLLAGWIGHLVRSPGALHQLPPHAPAYVVGLVDVKVRATGLYLVLPVTALVVLAFALWLPAALRRRPDAPVAEADGPSAPDETFAAAAAFRPSVLPPAEPPAAERVVSDALPRDPGQATTDGPESAAERGSDGARDPR